MTTQITLKENRITDELGSKTNKVPVYSNQHYKDFLYIFYKLQWLNITSNN